MMTELSPFADRCTAVMTSHLDSGENFEGAILFGVYPDNQLEIWILAAGVRTNINVTDVDAFCKQLKRAAKIAREQESPT